MAVWRSPLIRRIVLPAMALGVSACASRYTPAVPLQTRLGAPEQFGPGIVSANPRAIRFALEHPANVLVLRVTEAHGVEAIRPLRSRDRTRFARGTHLVTAQQPVSAPRGDRAGDGRAGAPVQERDQICAAIVSAGAVRDSSGRLVRDPSRTQRAYRDCIDTEGSRSTRSEPLEPHRAQATTPPALGYWVLIVSDVATSAGELQRQLATMDPSDDDAAAVARALPEVLVGARTNRWAAYCVPIL